MSKPSTVKTSPEAPEDAPLRKADIAAGKLVPRKRSPAGDRGYQTLIKEALKQAIQAESLEGVVRKTIREELRRA